MALTEIPIELSSTPSIVDGGNATAITIDSSENVGIGTSSPNSYASQTTLTINGSTYGRLDIESAGTLRASLFSTTGSTTLSAATDVLSFDTSGGEAMRIDSSGNVGITAAASLRFNGAGDNTHAVGYDSTIDGSFMRGQLGMRFLTGTGSGTERIRIDSNGRLLINTTSILSGSGAKLQVLQDVAGQWSQRINNSSTHPYGIAISYTSASPNDTVSQFLYFADTAAGRFEVTSNGNVGSATSSYGGMSDLKLKENIVDASSQWDDLKAVRVRNYSFKEENSSEPTQIGVIAQEVEAAGMAGLVYETPDKDIVEDGSFVDTGEVTKNMKYSILYMKAVKALQEAMERIETLEAKVQTLENN